MSSIPLKLITDLFYKCLNNRGTWYKNKNYEMVIWSDGSVHLLHYGTTIYHLDAKTGKVRFADDHKDLLGMRHGAYSLSDRDAIKSIAYYTGVGSAYIKDYSLYVESTGKMKNLNKMSKTPPKTGRRY